MVRDTEPYIVVSRLEHLVSFLPLSCVTLEMLGYGTWRALLIALTEDMSVLPCCCCPVTAISCSRSSAGSGSGWQVRSAGWESAVCTA